MSPAASTSPLFNLLFEMLLRIKLNTSCRSFTLKAYRWPTPGRCVWEQLKLTLHWIFQEASICLCQLLDSFYLTEINSICLTCLKWLMFSLSLGWLHRGAHLQRSGWVMPSEWRESVQRSHQLLILSFNFFRSELPNFRCLHCFWALHQPGSTPDLWPLTHRLYGYCRSTRTMNK